jgi:hypothetical protein
MVAVEPRLHSALALRASSMRLTYHRFHCLRQQARLCAATWRLGTKELSIVSLQESDTCYFARCLSSSQVFLLSDEAPVNCLGKHQWSLYLHKPQPCRWCFQSHFYNVFCWAGLSRRR